MAATGIGFKLAAAALVAIGLGKKSSGATKSVNFNPQGETAVAKLAVANLVAPAVSKSTSDAFNSAIVQITSNPVTDISIGATLITAAIGSPILAAVIGLIAELAFSIFSVYAYFHQEADMLAKGQTGAQDDLVKMCSSIVASLQPVFVQLGFAAGDAADLANLCGFCVARSYNDSGLNYFWNGALYRYYVTSKQNAAQGYTLNVQDNDKYAINGVVGSTNGCGYPVNSFSTDPLGGQPADQYWFARGCVAPIMPDQTFLNFLGITGDITALKAKGATMIADWANIYLNLDFIGRAAWCSMALASRWDCGGPEHFGGWISPPDGAEHDMAEWYKLVMAITGHYDASTKRLTDGNGSGLVWDVGQTFATSKMVVIAPS